MRVQPPLRDRRIGGACLRRGGDGEPGLWRQHGTGGHYAAFIRDPDGNRIEAVTFLNQA